VIDRLGIGIGLALIGALSAWLLSGLPNPLLPQPKLRWGAYTFENKTYLSAGGAPITILLVENLGRAAAKNVNVRLGPAETEIIISDEFLPHVESSAESHFIRIGYLPPETLLRLEVYGYSSNIIRSVSFEGEPVEHRALVGVSFQPVTPQELRERYLWIVIVAIAALGILAAIKSAPKKEERSDNKVEADTTTVKKEDDA
jgi:hypothetical protein